MRPSIPLLLTQIAAIVAGAPGCFSSSASCEGAPPPPPPKTVALTSDVACQIAQAGGVGWTTLDRQVGECVVPTYSPAGQPTYSDACGAACGLGTYDDCTLPDDYLQAYVAAQMPSGLCADADASIDAGSSEAGATVCPSVSGTINVTCSRGPCTGRWTSGVTPPVAAEPLSTGEYFATCSYFEAASVFAFERLASELTAHGAPVSLVRAARRAARDEVRHARTTRSLARRFGVEPTWPEAPDLRVRPLCEVARENATEGCVRETYGAVLGLVGAARASDADVRAAMESIARDECRHAELSWRVAAWATRRLDADDRAAVRHAMQIAARSLLAGDESGFASEHEKATGMPSGAEGRQIARLLDEALWAA